MKKKSNLLHNPMMITGAIALLGAVGTGVVTLARYITLPSRVEAVEDKTNKIESYIEKQQMANELMQQMIKQDKEILLSPDKKYFWDEESGEWRPIKELKERGK